VQLAGGANQAIRFHQRASVVRLRPQGEADGDEGHAKQGANDHHAPVGRLIGIMK
jgi:hypothetical protein